MTAHASVLERWLDAATGVYGDKMAHRAPAGCDPFHNPIGHVLRVNLSLLVSELFGAMDPATVAKAFENIVAVRAVQDVTVEQALGFVYALRRIVRAEMPTADIVALDERIDTFSLAAFTQYLRCRERLLDLRLNERLRALGPTPLRMRGQSVDMPSCSGCPQ